MNNKIILGTVQLGLDYGINNLSGKPSLEEAFDILDLAYSSGIKTLDTAEAYGTSMEVIGKFQKQYPNKNFNIISKLSANSNISNINLSKHVLSCCETLNSEQLYGYMFHNYESFIKNTKLYDEMISLKSEGIILNAGISLYTNKEIEDIIENFSDFDFIQIPFNLLDNDLKRASIILKAKYNGIAIHTRSTFLQGLFFMDPSQLPNKLLSLKPYVENVHKIASQNNLSPDELALQYVLQKDYIDYVLIGVDNKNQLEENIKKINKTFDISDKLIDTIDVTEDQLLNPSNWH